jgi:hypothetical protein
MNISTQELSSQKLFEVLQQEYIVCILRAKIYPIKKHKDFWSGTAEHKKEKICHLKHKLKQLSIFDAEEILKLYEKKIFNDYGLPNFYYSNEKVKRNQQYWDAKNYFAIGCEVNIIDEAGRQRKGKIRSINVPTEDLVIECDDKLSGVFNEVKFDVVSRIFDKLFC